MSGILERALPPGLRDAAVAQARDSFWAYCKLINPSFYKDSRPHLRELCDTLQALSEGLLIAPGGKPCRKLAISEPPRHGKSYTMNLFNQWCFGRDPGDNIINVSYNEILSGRFAKGVRDGISATRIDPRFRVFSDVFPGVKIKDGDAAAQMWSLEGSYFSFTNVSYASGSNKLEIGFDDLDFGLSDAQIFQSSVVCRDGVYFVSPSGSSYNRIDATYRNYGGTIVAPTANHSLYVEKRVSGPVNMAKISIPASNIWVLGFAEVSA